MGTTSTGRASVLHLYVRADHIPEQDRWVEQPVPFSDFAAFVETFQFVLSLNALTDRSAPKTQTFVRQVHLASPLVMELIFAAGVSVGFLAKLLRGFKHVYVYDLELRTAREEWKKRFADAKRDALRAELEEVHTEEEGLLWRKAREALTHGEHDTYERLIRIYQERRLQRLGVLPDLVGARKKVETKWRLEEVVLTDDEDEIPQG